jgi:hypothetical protein
MTYAKRQITTIQGASIGAYSQGLRVATSSLSPPVITDPATGKVVDRQSSRRARWRISAILAAGAGNNGGCSQGAPPERLDLLTATTKSMPVTSPSQTNAHYSGQSVERILVEIDAIADAGKE